MKTIVHIDLNAFFAQAEILMNPTLRGKPIAIGSDSRRGVLSTASYEARKYGVNSAMPVGQAKRLCPQLILIPGHYSLYSKLSKEFFGYLRKKYIYVEQASIDECYIDMTPFVNGKNLYDYLFDLQMELYRVTQLKCSIGAGATRFLAKMGSDYKKPLGLTIIDQKNIQDILWPLSITKFFGIGKQTAPKLEELGIHTIGDLALTKDDKVMKCLGKMFSYFQNEANGYGDDSVSTEDWDPKSMSAERTFAEDVTGEDELSTMIYSCCKQIVSELISYHKKACTIGIKLRTPDFSTKSKRMMLTKPTNNLEELYNNAMKVFDSFYHDQEIRLLGVSADKVIDEKEDIEEENDLLIKLNSSLKQGGKIIKGSDLKS